MTAIDKTFVPPDFPWNRSNDHREYAKKSRPTGPYDLSVEEVRRAWDDSHVPSGLSLVSMTKKLNTLIESKRAQSSVEADSELMELVQLYRSRWLSCVTPEEAQRLRDEIERLRKFEEYDKRLRESGARARASYSDDVREPST